MNTVTIKFERGLFVVYSGLRPILSFATYEKAAEFISHEPQS